MSLLMPHRNSRQMGVVRLDAKANKRKSPTRLCLPHLLVWLYLNALLRGYFLNAAAKVPLDHKQLLISY
jgi:hypothetical protein